MWNINAFFSWIKHCKIVLNVLATIILFRINFVKLHLWRMKQVFIYDLINSHSFILQGAIKPASSWRNPRQRGREVRGLFYINDDVSVCHHQHDGSAGRVLNNPVFARLRLSWARTEQSSICPAEAELALYSWASNTREFKFNITISIWSIVH